VKRVLVVGGGISGLAAAHRLSTLSAASRAPFEVVLAESSGRLGGKILGEKTAGGAVIEAGPDSFLAQKPQAMDLIRELGLAPRLIEAAESRVFVYVRGRLRPLPEGLFLMAPRRLIPFLASDFMTWRGKIRMALDLFHPRGTGEDQSMEAFAARHFGREAVETLVQPILAGIHGGEARALGLKSTFPRFLDLERSHGSVIRGLRAPARNGGGRPAFMSLAGGLSELVDALASRLGPEKMRLNARILRISRAGGAWRADLEGGGAFEADGVLLAAPACAAAEMVSSSMPGLAESLRRIPFVSTGTISLAYGPSAPRLPDGAGAVVAAGEVRTVSAMTFTSRKFPTRSPGGAALLRCFFGGAGREALLDLDDGELVSRVRADVERLLGIGRPPDAVRLHRWRKANPQYLVGHEDLLGRLQALLEETPGLWLTGSSYRGVGIPDCVASGLESAEQAARFLSAPAGGAKFV